VNIKLKHSNSRWVKIEDAEFKIDYPTIEQNDEIEELKDQIILLQSIDMKEGETQDEYAQRFVEEIGDLSIENKSKAKRITKQYCRLYIKYTIKDWKNINDESGEPVKCKVVNDMLDETLFDSLVKNMTFLQLLTFLNKIKPEVEFTDSDKKKFSSDSITEEAKN